MSSSNPLGAATDDYDLFILNSTGTTIISSSTTVQNGSQDPYEQVTAPSAGQRVVVVLRFWRDLPIEEIATRLDCPAGTVKSRLHAAIVALRSQMDRDAGEVQR